MSGPNSVRTFVPALPTREIGSIPLPGKKPSKLDSQSEPLKPLVSIVPRNFVKAAPRSRLPNYAQNLNRSSSSQDENPGASEESSETVEESPSTELEKSAEENLPSVMADISASDQALRISVPWKPDAATRQRQRRREVQRSDKPPPARQTARRNLVSSGDVRKKLELGELSVSREFEAVLNVSSELDHAVEPKRKNQQTSSIEPKNTIIELIPKFDATKTSNRLPATEAKVRKLQKAMLKQLRTSELYSEAARAQKLPESMGVTMCPRILETYLSSLLNDERSRETIRDCRLTASEAVAIRYYGLEGFQFVQPSLREKADPALGADFAPAGTFDNLIKECQGAFAKLPLLPPGTELFRGTDFLFQDELPVGETYLDPAFVSSSTSKEVATQRFKGRFLLSFEVPEKDPRFRDVSSLTGNPKEAEVLGLPNIRFRVVARGEGAGTPEDPEIVRLSPIAII